ncbi:MAG: hypothetical protein WDN28_25415 [Chthoniobacter sp.]
MTVVKGTTAHIYATQQLKKSACPRPRPTASCVLEVAQGKAEAFLFDQLSTLQNWHKNPETTRAILNPFQPRPGPSACAKATTPCARK